MAFCGDPGEASVNDIIQKLAAPSFKQAVSYTHLTLPTNREV